MPFFANAKDFKIEHAEMNDVAGNLNKTVNNTTTNNKDAGNVAIGSVVTKGNTNLTNTDVGTGDGNKISF
ncbi:hypothetical protein APHAL10511_000296 [Amanita phalloides]|nr:hypothetical protein APHAL10511_000296 [Amanita phalloides]